MADIYENFFSFLEISTKDFSESIKNKRVKVIGHLDSDGISATAILINALNNENAKYSSAIIPQLTIETLKTLDGYDVLIFADLGSAFIKEISELNKKAFIFDHHDFSSKDITDMKNIDVKKYSNVVHINPHIFGINGSMEISGSGVAYLFCELLNKKNEKMIEIALVGAIGDMQESNGFIGLNQIILQKAMKLKKINVQYGLKLFGSQTKPLFKILQYSTNPYIPGVTGNEEKTLRFLNQIKINPKVGTTWRKLRHLTKEENQRLIDAIIRLRADEDNPEDVMGNIYLLPDEDEDSPYKDLKEFSTLLNACGRLNKATIGIGACLGDVHMKEEAMLQMKKYRQEVLNGMNWYLANKKTNMVIKGKGYIILNPEDKIIPTLIGTICSIIAKSGEVEKNILILGISRDKNMYKASLRISGHKIRKETNLKNMLSEICKNIDGCYWGGHTNASGTIIPLDKKDMFIENAVTCFSKYELEEFID